jgi:hypothetical protein
MTDGVQFQSNEVEIVDAALDFFLIRGMIAVRAQAGQPEEPAGMARAQIRDLIVSLAGFFGSGVGLDDGGINAAFVHAAQHLFLGAQQAKNAALAKMRMRIDSFLHRCYPRSRLRKPREPRDGLVELADLAAILNYGS